MAVNGIIDNAGIIIVYGYMAVNSIIDDAGIIIVYGYKAVYYRQCRNNPCLGLYGSK